MINQKVLFNTWNAAFFIVGGGEIQLLNSRKYLEQKKVNIQLYDMWKPQLDIDIFHQFSSVPGVENVVDAYRAAGKKIVMSPIFWNENLTEKYPLHFHYRSLFNKVDILLTNSELESQLISRLFNIPPEKCHKTRNSISNEYLDQKTTFNFKKEYNIEGDFILTVANIDERKNTQRLVKACEELGIKLVSIGATRHLEQLNAVKESPNFLSLGTLSDTNILKSAYQACSLFILPSMCETPGIAALEAASQGSKIVITECGSAKEYFQDHVTYVNPWSTESIVEGIKTERNLTRDDTLSKFVCQNYTWDKTAIDIIEGYKKIL